MFGNLFIYLFIFIFSDFIFVFLFLSHVSSRKLLSFSRNPQLCVKKKKKKKTEPSLPYCRCQFLLLFFFFLSCCLVRQVPSVDFPWFIDAGCVVVWPQQFQQFSSILDWFYASISSFLLVLHFFFLFFSGDIALVLVSHFSICSHYEVLHSSQFSRFFFIFPGTPVSL